MKNELNLEQLSITELQESLETEKMHLTKMKLNHKISPLENPNKIKQSKRTVARILTELRKREIVAAKQVVAQQ